MTKNEESLMTLLTDMNNGFVSGKFVKIPSIKQLDNRRWVVYFYEDGLIYSAIYYTEERAKARLEIEEL